MTRLRARLSRLRRRPFALVALLLLALVSAGLTLRAMMLVVHLGLAPGAGEAPALEGWMTPRYISRTWDVPPEVMQRLLGLPEGDGRRVTLTEIAAARGEPLGALLARIEAELNEVVPGARTSP